MQSQNASSHFSLRLILTTLLLFGLLLSLVLCLSVIVGEPRASPWRRLAGMGPVLVPGAICALRMKQISILGRRGRVAPSHPDALIPLAGFAAAVAALNLGLDFLLP